MAVAYFEVSFRQVRVWPEKTQEILQALLTICGLIFEPETFQMRGRGANHSAAISSFHHSSFCVRSNMISARWAASQQGTRASSCTV
jgi:hypothetical protein